MELKVSEVQEIAPITFNFEELKKELTEKSQKYATAVYTEDTITEAKQHRASLNKLVKAVNDEKIRKKNEVMKPYLPFETQCKELMNFDTIYNERWGNVTYEMKTIHQEIDHIFAKAKNDLMTINNIVQNEETNKQVTDFYFRNINKADCLSLTLNEAKAIEAVKSRINEMKNKEEKQVEETAKQTIIPKSEQEQKRIQLYELRFKVAITKEQMSMLKEFFINNNIKFERLV